MGGRDLLCFSNCGQHFAHCGADGKLRLWETSAGILKQEFVPNLHLSSPCTALTWINLSNSSLTWKNRKRKHDRHSTKVIGVGTMGGSLALYSVTEGKVILTLQGEHTSKVNSIAWSKDEGLFSVAQNVVINWDISNKSVKSKLKCGKGNTTCIAVTDDGELCVTGSCTLKLWQFKTQTLLKTLTGHSSDITNLSFINQQYFISTAANDRHIAAWNVSGEGTDPVARFALSDSISSKISVMENGGSVHLAAVTKSGIMHFFQQQLNGKCGKSVKPTLTLEVAVEKSTGPGVSTLPVVGVYISSVTSVSIAYGYMPKYAFEAVDIREAKDGRICLVRTDNRKVVVNSNKVTAAISEDVEYVNVNGAVKRKADHKQVDVPMEERLDKLSIAQSSLGGSSKPSPHSMALLLVQGLDSKDRTILESVLFRRDAHVIKETVARLPLHALNPLIKELVIMLQGKTMMSCLAGSWLKCIVATHAGHLLSDKQTCDVLTRLHGLLETRLLALPKLSALSGRLDLVLQQVSEPSKQNQPDVDALLIYQDEVSSDEESIMLGEIEGSESEDRWEELSDQEVDTDDANMSSFIW